MRTFERTAIAFALGAMVAVQAAAQAPGELLEKAIYAEETQGDLGAAIKLYESIAASASAERGTVAQALFRLGMCYLKSGRRDEAGAAFQKLAKEYPEQKTLLAKIPAEVTSLALGPAPWPREETLVMLARLEGSTLGGPIVFRLTHPELGGREVCRLETYRTGVFTRVHVDPATFAPLDGQYDMPFVGVTSRATYREGGVDHVRTEKGESKRQPVTFSKAVYDNEEVVQMIRRLPLAEGYSTTLTVLGIGAPVLVDVKLDVLGREKVTVPAGTFDTFKVNLGLFMDGRRVEDQKFWYSTDARRYPVKFENRAVVELTEVIDGPRPDGAVNDDAVGVTVGAPDGWLLVKGLSRPGELRVHVLAPEMAATGTLYVIPLGKQDPRTAAAMAESHIESSQRKFNVYAVRGGEPESVELSGQPALRFAADYTHPVTAKSMVEYRAFLSHNDRRVTFHFDVEQPRWESLRPALDHIVASLKLR